VAGPDPWLADSQRSVEVGNGDVRLILHRAPRSTESAEWVLVRLVGPGLDAIRTVDPAGALPAFFAELAEDWQGWDGAREWFSMDGELRLVCYHDRIGHIEIEVSVGRVPPPGWQTPGWMAQAMLVVDPGALQVLSTALSHLLVGQ